MGNDEVELDSLFEELLGIATLFLVIADCSVLVVEFNPLFDELLGVDVGLVFISLSTELLELSSEFVAIIGELLGMVVSIFVASD